MDKRTRLNGVKGAVLPCGDARGSALCPPEAPKSQNKKSSAGTRNFKTAAPSWVMMGSVYENCVFLENKVDEIALLFFETESCLAYGEEDLPRALAELDLSYHVHLPLDLPWHDAELVAKIVLGLMEKVRFLDVRCAVLHPPLTTGKNAVSVQVAQQSLRVVAHAWSRHGFDCNDLLIENLEGADLCDLAPVIVDLGLGVCIDTGHIIAYGHGALLERADILGRIRMIHVNAPADVTTAKGRSKHVSLVHLDADGYAKTRRVLQYFGQHCGHDSVLVYELFKWKHIETTIPVVEEMLSTKGR